MVEALGAINWYFQGHAYKWMTDAGIVHRDDDSGETDFQLRTQIQTLF